MEFIECCEKVLKLLLCNDRFLFLLLSFKISQDSAEDVEEEGALAKVSGSVSPSFSEAVEEDLAIRKAESESFSLDDLKDQPSSPKGEETPPENITGSDLKCAASGEEKEVTSLGDGQCDSATPVQPLPETENSDSASITSGTEPKRIAYPQIVKEGRRFNIDLISKVGNSLTISFFTNLSLFLILKISVLH